MVDKGGRTKKVRESGADLAGRIGSDLKYAARVGDAISFAVDSNQPPLDRLEASTFLMATLELLQAEATADARALGVSWAKIGDSLGYTAQGALSWWNRLKRRPKPWPKWAEAGAATTEHAKWEARLSGKHPRAR